MNFWKELSLKRGFKMSRQPRWRQRERQRRNRLRLESFRFQDEIWINVFSRILKNRHPGKLHCTFLAREKLQLLSVLMEIKTSPEGKKIKVMTFDNLFPPLQHSRKNSSVEWRRLPRFPAKWRWFTRVHYLVLRKSHTRSRTRLRI